MSGGAMSTMSCTSSNKLPFALFHLVNWVVSEYCTLLCHCLLCPLSWPTLNNTLSYYTLQTRIMVFFYLVTVYGAIGNEIKHHPRPMTCFGGSVDPNQDETYCPVSEEYHAVLPVHVLCISMSPFLLSNRCNITTHRHGFISTSTYSTHWHYTSFLAVWRCSTCCPGYGRTDWY